MPRPAQTAARRPSTRPRSSIARWSIGVGGAFALACLAACAPRTGADTGQVLARVGSGEITLLQLEQLLSTSPSGLDPAVRRAALESLIDRQLVAERARADGLDRDPAVLAILETSRRQLLAQAWIDRHAAALPPPDNEAMRNEYDARQHAYARRRAYVIDEIVLTDDAIDASAMQEAAERARGAAETANWLRARGLPHQRRLGASTSDQMPDPLARLLESVREGACVVVRDTGKLRVLWIQQARPDPWSFDEARDPITLRLAAAARERAVVEILQSLRAATPVAYADRVASTADGDGVSATRSPR